MDIADIDKCQYEIQEQKDVPLCYSGINRPITNTASNAKFIISFAIHPDLLLHDSAVRFARELWWTNHEFPTASIIPSRFSMIIYHLGGGGDGQ
jgi:hypothetical protein